MNAIYLVITLCFSFTMPFSGYTQKYFEISGKSEDAELKYLILERKEYIDLKVYCDTLWLNGGKFDYRWQIDGISSFAKLRVSNSNWIDLYVIPGKRETINISKDGQVKMVNNKIQNVNTYLLLDSILNEKLIRGYSLRPQKFNAFLISDQDVLIGDSIVSKRLKYLNEYFSDVSDPETKDFIEQHNWSIIYANVVKKFKSNGMARKYLPINEYLNPDGSVASDPKMLSNPAYLFFIKEFVLRITKGNLEKAGSQDDLDAMIPSLFKTVDQISDNHKYTTPLKISLLNELLSELQDLGQKEKDIIGGHIASFISSLKEEEETTPRIKILEANLNSSLNFLEEISIGKRAPSFNYVNANGKILSLDDLRGKLIYIDSWFTGCKYCVEMYPHWNKLVEQYRDRGDVAFLSISFDRTDHIWKDIVQKHNILGSVGYASPMEKDGFVSKYKIVSGPTYILIGKDGKILEPRASGPDLIDLDRYL